MRFLSILLFFSASVAIAQDETTIDKGEVVKTESDAALRGLAFAEEACAVCHSITADQNRSPNRAAATFVTIANTSGMTRMAFGAYLQTSHPTMPNLIIEPSQIDDLWAYMSTLRTDD